MCIYAYVCIFVCMHVCICIYSCQHEEVQVLLLELSGIFLKIIFDPCRVWCLLESESGGSEGHPQRTAGGSCGHFMLVSI